MARIPVNSKEAAFKIFTTLNDRGLRLSPPDLLLSYLMETATEAERPRIRGVWTQMLQKMELTTLTVSWARWVSRYGDLKDELFDALKDHIEKNRVNSLVFAKECLDECDDYMALMMADESEIPKEALHFVRALTRELKFKPAIPLLLSSYLVLPTKEFAKSHSTCWFSLRATQSSKTKAPQAWRICCLGLPEKFVE